MTITLLLAPATLFFVAAALLFSGASKRPPATARTVRSLAAVALAAGLVLLGVGIYGLLTD